MKSKILTAAFLLLSIFPMMGQHTVYIVDNNVVEAFDGSQIKGKVITDYKITTKGSGKKAVTVHTITTGGQASGWFHYIPAKPKNAIPAPFNPDSTYLNTHILLVDGKVIENWSDFNLKSYEIQSVEVIKNPDELREAGYDRPVINIKTVQTEFEESKTRMKEFRERLVKKQQEMRKKQEGIRKMQDEIRKMQDEIRTLQDELIY